MEWLAWEKDDDVDLDCKPHSMNRRIWQERVRIGLSREQVSELSGLSIARVKGLETRERPPTLVDIVAFTKLFGMDSQYILIGERRLARDEAALVDNYRNSTPDSQATIRKISAALEKQIDDGEMCA